MVETRFAAVCAAAFLVCAGLLSPARLARAADDASTEQALALEVAGKHSEALALYEKVPEDQRTPRTRYHVAYCKERVGRLADAAADLEKLAVAPGVPPEVAGAAASDLDDLRPRVPKLAIRYDAKTSGLAVTVDGRGVLVPSAVAVNPGAHVVEAKEGARAVFRAEVVAVEGKGTEVVVAADDAAAISATGHFLAASGGAKSDRLVAPVDAPRNGSKVGPWVAFGAAGAFLGVAIVSRVQMNSALETLKSECAVSLSCPEEERSRVHRWETASWAALGAAVTASVVGIVLLREPNEKTQPTLAETRIAPAWCGTGCGSVNVSGAF